MNKLWQCILLMGLMSLSPLYPGQRGLRVAPVTPLPAQETAGNCGVFVGVAQFDSESGLPELRYTEEDAVALAYLFCREVALIPVRNAWIGLSGKPLSAESERKLGELRAAGINETGTRKLDILRTIRKVSHQTQDSDAMILLTMATHGYELNGQVYLMPSNGDGYFVDESGVPFQSIQDTLQLAKANKRVIIMDACRESPYSETRGSGQAPDKLMQALRNSEGVAVISSASTGELSWESEDFKHGVFTHYFMEGVKGAAEADRRSGVIKLGAVSKYASQKTIDWSSKSKSIRQTPWFEGELAREIPLAISQAFNINYRREVAKVLLRNARKASIGALDTSTYSGALSALSTWRGADLEELLDQIDLLNGDTMQLRQNFSLYWKSKTAPQPKVSPTKGYRPPI